PVYSTMSLTGAMATSSAAPSGLAVNDITFDKASLTWTTPAVGGNAGEYTYLIEVATDSGFTSQIAGSPFTSATNSYNLTDLEQGTTYLVRVRTNNGFSYSPYSTSTAFATLIPGQVGLGATTTSGNFPVSSGTAFSYSQQIYTKAEVEANLEEGQNFITKIKFFYNGNNSNNATAGAAGTVANFNDWTIYLGNTDKSSFTNTTDWISIDDMQESFSGTVDLVPGTWVEIILDTPFQWNGEDNIVVAVDENASGTYSTGYFRSFTVADSNRGMYRTLGSDINPASPGTASSRGNVRSQIAFEAIETPDCMPVTGLGADNETPYTVDLSWAGTESLFDVIYGAPGFNPESEGTMVSDIAENPYTLTGLSPQTTYQVYVREHCGSSLSPWTGPVRFTTSCVPFGVPYFEGFEN